MSNDTTDLTKEILFASPEAVASRRLSALERQGVLRKIAPRIYTTNLHDAFKEPDEARLVI